MFSTTQASNYITLAGLLVLILQSVGITIPEETLVTAIAGAVALFSIGVSIVNRYKKGDITIAGTYR